MRHVGKRMAGLGMAGLLVLGAARNASAEVLSLAVGIDSTCPYGLAA
jgi:hypothetical protein